MKKTLLLATSAAALIAMICLYPRQETSDRPDTNRTARNSLIGQAPGFPAPDFPLAPEPTVIAPSIFSDLHLPPNPSSENIHILPYRFLRGDPEMLASTPDRPLQRRVRLFHAPEFKYSHIRVDQIFRIAPNGDEELLHEVAMVADHVIASIPTAGEMKLPPGATRLGNSHVTLCAVPSSEDGDPIAARIAELDAQGIYAEPDYLVQTSGERIPNDPSFSQLWGMTAVGAPQAWDSFTGSGSVVVGVIDTGVDPSHPDLVGNLWQNPGEIAGNGIDDDGNGYVDDIRGWNFYDNNANPTDLQGHGTHCAGTIGARGNNGTGVAGVTWQVQIAAIKFLGPNGGSTSDAIRAVDYATNLGITITNNSWGGGGYSQLLKESIGRADAAGMVFVAAAGNSGRDVDSSPSYPAAYEEPNIISVAAQQPDFSLAGFSNFGARGVDIAAPGQGILSTVPGGYDTYNGTSMAAPHVTGALALVKGRFPDTTGRDLKRTILEHAAPRPELTGKCLTGGMLALHRIFGGDGTPNPPDPGNPVSTALARGSAHFLKLNADGTVLQWGNDAAKPVPVAGLNDAIQVAAGENGWSIALRRDGTVVSWSGSSFPSPIGGLTGIVEIAAGSTQLLARRGDGTVWAHGRSYISQGLGDGVTTTTAGAVQVTGIQDAKALAAGQSHNTVLRSDGTLVSWGYNHSGQLGDGTSIDRKTPVPVSGISGIRSISLGSGTLLIGNGTQFYILGNHSLAVKTDGTLWSWGHNREGELGYSSPSNLQLTPRQIPGLSDIRSATAGMWNSYAINAQGRIFAWGWNGYGQLGLGHNFNQDTPALIPGVFDAVEIAAGGRTAGALLADGSVWAWGSADGGSLGNGIVPEMTYRPVDPGLSDIAAIGAGYDGSAFVTTSGHVWATGSSINWEFYNPFLTGASTLNSPAKSSYSGIKTAPGRTNNTEYELLTNGTVRFAGSSTLVPNLANITSISTWGWAGAAIRNNGTLLTWGQNGHGNAYGQLGDGTTVSRPDARQVAGLANIVSADVADYHMLAADSSGRVYAWGSGSYGKLGDGSSSDRSSPIQVPGLSSVVQVAAGGSHSLALTSSGALYVWGSSSTCGLGLTRTTPALLPLPEPVAYIAAGPSHSLAVTISGKVWSWGVNTSCQLGNGTRNGSVTPVGVSLIINAVKVSAGRDHSIALLADGTVRLWGSNALGQIGNGESRSEIPVLVLAPGGLARTSTLSFAAASDFNWFSSHFSEAELKNPSISGDNADPDHDGLSNLVEYALGSGPKTFDRQENLIHWSLESADDTMDHLPGTSIANAPRHLTCTIIRQVTRPDVAVTAEFSSDLKSWLGETQGVTEDITTDPLTLRFRATSSDKESPRLFGRVKVSRLAN